jgi:hypothetical protein
MGSPQLAVERAADCVLTAVLAAVAAAFVVVLVVDAGVAAAAVVEPPVAATAAVADVVVELDATFMAMPSPSVLASPTLRDAASARLRAAG